MSDDDPFEELEEEVEDREGDPFDRLGYPEEHGDERALGEEGAEESTEADDDAESTEGARSRWGEPLDPDMADESVNESETAEGQDGGSAIEPDPDPDVAVGPGGDVETPAQMDDVGHREGDPFEAMGEAFTEMDVEGVDPDEVWEQLSSAQASGSVTEKQSRTYADVSKHSYCEQCEHFSEPPAVACSHEGTEIVEFLDMTTVRVVDCPVVAERKELEGE